MSEAFFCFFREAFQATLEIENSENDPLENVQVEIVIRQVGTGSVSTSLFSLGNATTSGDISASSGRHGDLGWFLPQDGKGSLEWLFVPYSEAAPEMDTLYDVGGQVSEVWVSSG